MNHKEIERNMKALANKRRLAILRYLKSRKEATVGDIAGEIRLSFKSTSRHLGVLFSADILEREQKGLEVYYRLAAGISNSARPILSLL